MELNKTNRWFYALTLLWMVMLLGLGSWWLYLVFKLHATLSALSIPELGPQGRFLNMMKWEGSFFFIFLVLLGVSLFWMYVRDMQKSKATQAFFASLSHELKTPLASMRLQAEVIKDLIEEEDHSHEQLSDLARRLVEDSFKLESELEKSLQLSRLEQGGPLTLVPISLDRYLKRHQQRLPPELKVSLEFGETSPEILADELALNMVFRNLFENTIRHRGLPASVSISGSLVGEYLHLTYDDHGKKFEGNVGRLGSLFYKYNSTKGSGIGLYLIKGLMAKMQGEFRIENRERLKFCLGFKTPEDGNV
jgi:signal transduction histidine kinase